MTEKRALSLGYSPCPNDTFIFHAMVRGRVDTGGLVFQEALEDVETLNRMALQGQLDLTKVSYAACGALRENYCLLRSGGALGRGCGPLVVARDSMGLAELRGRPLAIPGRHTTAFLLLRLADPELGEHAVPMPFHEIMDAVRSGAVDAGLIIHESRFTYPRYGLTQVADLGQWWERETGHPIPLGCIIARRTLGKDLIRGVEGLIRESVLHARAHPTEPAAYIREHAQEMEDDVIQQHISLYVNEWSVDLGDDGVRAVETLFRMAEEREILPPSDRPLLCH
jgi:1,4-dihydroxy-6-naphthoate synthase